MSFKIISIMRGVLIKPPRICMFVYLLVLPLICGVFTAQYSHFNVGGENEKPTENEIYAYILKIGIKYPDVVFMQARIESGNFKSALFKKHANMFGMRHPRKRATESLRATKTGYAVFKNWRASVLDYALWQSRILYKSGTKQKYIAYLSRVYAECPQYSKIFKNIQ